MDEVKARIRPQGSVCSDSNGDDTSKNDLSSNLDSRLCLVGNLSKDLKLRSVAETFGIPVVTSKDGQEFAQDDSCHTIFVLENFEGDVFNRLNKLRLPLLGPPALQQLAARKEKLPDNTRPLYTLAMTGVVVCFMGFRNKDELTMLVPLIHHMGGSIRKDMSAKVTHLIANSCGGEKYQYAVTFRLPVMNLQWVHSSWKRRHELDFVATLDTFVAEHKLKPFHGAKVCFVGFDEKEENHMVEVLLSNGGIVTTLDDPNCTHVVVDDASGVERPDGPPRAWVVKAEWFWTSVQKEISLLEKEFLYDDRGEQGLSPVGRRDSLVPTPSSGSRRKRKRLHETLSSLVQPQSPALHKRRSSISDAGLLSVSGSFLDCTTSPNKEILEVTEPLAETPRKGLTQRHQVFLELLQTESNYVDILHTIMTMFKKHLEDMPDEEALLNNTELNLIFGKLPPIYETHVKMLDEFRWTLAHWNEERSIGNIIVKYSSELLKAYPPFINYFEEMKEVLCQCDQNKPRFHAFLKACQTRPECGRQSLKELMMRPVQRLGSMSLLLADILKNTQKTNPDYPALDQALAALREVMTHINEDKRKTEGQVTLFNIFNDIDNCPPDIVSSHRCFIAKAEVVQLSSSEGLSSKGNNLVLFLFSDQLEVCKKKSKAFNSLKSPSTVGGSLQSKPNAKPYKHVKLMALNTIKRVIDIKETEECQKVFSLVCRNNDDMKERLYSFAMDEDADKPAFLKTLTRQMANNACTADADKFMAYLEPQQLDIDTSDVSNGTLSKAFKFATTRLKVGRAFSFNKTPSKLKRAVSSMMSPFGSSTNLTPASQLAQMKLASYSNLNELSNTDNADSQPVAPMSVQPTRKVKSSSLGVNTLKRL
ncbi:epithelial cell transforming 2 pebble isoform X3 [Leptinotarsa decemlineata]|uniref:epithelial cell transforming 2 pebble isoform X3 n=1 Tax=Leptinotarsa decemlineata TaxID=7539 RepID=UPI003D30BFB3